MFDLHSDADDEEGGPSSTPPPTAVQQHGLAPLLRNLDRLSNFFEIATLDDAEHYADDDPLATTMTVFRKFVGNTNEWLGNGERVSANMSEVFSDIWYLFEEIEKACGGYEFVPVEYRRRVERMYETLHHVRGMLYTMRRVSLLRAPESIYLAQNQELKEAVVTQRAKKNGNHADFQMLASCWDCECNAAFGVGTDLEDNSNPFRQRPIGLDNDTLDELGKHVRWTWNPPAAPKDLKAYQRFVLYLLDQARIRGYRRHRRSIYERVVTAHGRFTPAWRRVGDISAFVRGEVIDRSVNFKEWCDATTEKGNISAATAYLEECLDPSLPLLQKSRRFYAFANGVYVTYLRYGDQVMDYFSPYNSTEGIPVENVGELAAVKYFNIPFRYAQYDEIDWFSIPTPAMSAIFDFQGFPEDVQRWHWVLLGRLFHNANDLDGWQTCLFIRGVAQSGKSTIGLFFKGFFEPEDIGIIANNMEPQFGWGVMFDKLVCMGLELRAEFAKNTDQAVLQSIISGELVSLAIKNHDPVTGHWKAPVLMIGNDEMSFSDSSGQVARRIVSVEYMCKVMHVDASLPSRLEAERDLVLLKANRAYLAAVNTVGNDELWKHLPDYFKKLQAASFASNNSYAHMLAHAPLVFGAGLYVPHRVFTRVYTAHCSAFGVPKMPWRRLNITTIFNAKGLRVGDETETLDWNGSQVTDVFIHGVDLQTPGSIDVSNLY